MQSNVLPTRSIRYPRFHVSNLHMNDWIGNRDSYKSHGLTDRAILSSPCLRWADLSITSTGDVALCCMDAKADYNLGNALSTNVLDLYRAKVRKILENEKFMSRRLDVPDNLPCAGCNYFQAGSFRYRNLDELMLDMHQINHPTS